MSFLEENYHKTSKLLHVSIFKQLLGKLPSPIQEGWRVADLGCGTGTNTEIVSKLVGDSGFVLALDPYSERLNMLRSRIDGGKIANVEVLQQRAENCPYDGYAPFDLIYSNIVLHWIPDAELKIAVQKAYSALRPGGIFAICAAEMTADEGCWRGLIYKVLPAEVRETLAERCFSRPLNWYAKLIEDCGFQIIKKGHLCTEVNSKDVDTIVEQTTSVFEGIIPFKRYLTRELVEESGFYVVKDDGSFLSLSTFCYVVASKVQ